MVSGDVRQPGRVSLLEGVRTVVEAINKAGGPSGVGGQGGTGVGANQLEVVMRRNGQIILQSQYSDLLAGADVGLQKNDEIVVRPNARMFTVLGAVVKAGNVDMPKHTISLLEAMGMVGGLNDARANKTGVYVFRMGDLQNNPTARARVFRLDLYQPVSIFIAQQFPVQPKDVVYITNAPLYEYDKILTSIYRTFSIVGRPERQSDHLDDLLEATFQLGAASPGVFWYYLLWRRQESSLGGAAGLAAFIVIAGLILWMMPSRQTSSAQDGPRPLPPLISRGYTDAPSGTALIAGDPAGGGVLIELKVTDGQKVKLNDVIAVLSNYPKADIAVRTSEAELAKTEKAREAMVSGYRRAEIAMQEVVVKSAVEENKLKVLEMQRSGKPPDQKQLELNISQQSLEREQAKLRIQRETLESDLQQSNNDIAIIKAKLDNARSTREQALVRSPLDGIVIQIYTRQGERISPNGIAKIVDLSQLRVLADVDELNVGRIAAGGKVEVTFRGSPTVYAGTISRVAPTVKRMQRMEPDGGSSTDARVVQVEIQLDDPSSMPQVLGRETRVTFL